MITRNPPIYTGPVVYSVFRVEKYGERGELTLTGIETFADASRETARLARENPTARYVFRAERKVG